MQDKKDAKQNLKEVLYAFIFPVFLALLVFIGWS